MIKKIYLKNFKCFEEISLECGELNLFTGINGMGKSTLIQALLLLRQTFEKSSPSEKGHLSLNGKYVNLGKTEDISYWYRKDEDIQIIVEEEEQTLECIYHQEKKKLIWKTGNQTPEKSVLLGKRFEYISAERLGPRRYYDNLEGEPYEATEVGIKGEHAVSCLYSAGSDLKVYENMKHPAENSERLELQVNAWMSEISPGVKVKAIPYLEADMMGLRYGKQTVFGEESANAIHMGFGVSYVLPVIISLLKAKKGDLLIIENPEAHLHPKGQRMLGELVARASANEVQIILETHSDHVLNGIRLSVKQKSINKNQVKLNYFGTFKDWDGMIKHEKTSPEILEDGSLSFWPEGFFDEWDKAIDLLF